MGTEREIDREEEIDSQRKRTTLIERQREKRTEKVKDGEIGTWTVKQIIKREIKTDRKRERVSKYKNERERKSRRVKNQFSILLEKSEKF